MVGRESPGKPFDEVPIAQDGEVFLSQTGGPLLHQPAVALAVRLADESHVTPQQLPDGALAARPTKDEGDGW